MAAQSSPGRRFPQSSRLKHSAEFSRLRLSGERIVNGCLIANWRRLPAGSASRLGVVTSAKIGGAVVRSRARRLLREAFRLHQREFSAPVDLVLVARQSIAKKDCAGVTKDLLAALRRAGVWTSAPQTQA